MSAFLRDKDNTVDHDGLNKTLNSIDSSIKSNESLLNDIHRNSVKKWGEYDLIIKDLSNLLKDLINRVTKHDNQLEEYKESQNKTNIELLKLKFITIFGGVLVAILLVVSSYINKQPIDIVKDVREIVISK